MIAQPNRRLQIERLENRAMLSGVPQQVVVMSENLYMGADPIPIIAASHLSAQFGAGPALTKMAVTNFWNNVKATNYSKRADAIAQQIADNKPDLIGLQEVMTYYTGAPDSLTQKPTPATNVKLDFLQVLQGKLAAKGLKYKAYKQELGDFEAPGFIDGQLKDLRMVDSMVILARSDLPASQVSYVNPQGGKFVTSLTVAPTVIGPITIHRGWNAIDVNWGKTEFRFVNMCLETPSLQLQQRLQGLEILVGPAWTTKPLILVGDSNSDGATANGWNSATYGMLTADFTNFGIYGRNLYDAWSQTHPSDPGYTWGNAPDLKNKKPMDYQPLGMGPFRMDLVLHRDAFQATSMSRLGVDTQTYNAFGMWPSDHAGVVATLAIKQTTNTAAGSEAFEYYADAAATWLSGQLLAHFSPDLVMRDPSGQFDASANRYLDLLIADKVNSVCIEHYEPAAYGLTMLDSATARQALNELSADAAMGTEYWDSDPPIGLEQDAFQVFALDALLDSDQDRSSDLLLACISELELDLLAAGR